MYGVPVMPMSGWYHRPPGRVAGGRGPMTVGPVSQIIAPVVAL